jgi:virginiamycin B lyase
MPDPRVRDPHSLTLDGGGNIFFTAQESNFVGRLDPKTGKVDVKEVPTTHSNPYGIIIGPDGAAWFCEFGSNKIGRIDAKTLAITEFSLPEAARPRRIANNPDGLIYYSDFARGFLGRLDPRSGKVEEWRSPGGSGSHPYGIASTSDGIVWYSESGVQPNTLVAFDPKTHSFQKWPIPSGGGIVRNMVATPDGRLYLACSGVNKVAIAIPASEKSAR